MSRHSISRSAWDAALDKLLASYNAIAVVDNGFGFDYEIINPADTRRIAFNQPKPVTPLKTLFLPVKEPVTRLIKSEKPALIIGAPNCDVMALKILDEIYLDPDFTDLHYKQRRENSTIISTDCKDINEHCHCMTYGVKPYATEVADISLLETEDKLYLSVLSKKGEKLISILKEIPSNGLEDGFDTTEVDKIREETIGLLEKKNMNLPDYRKTGELIAKPNVELWKKYAADCVSCGACSTICPTCSCFLLNDKPGFEKVRQLDACQYPGFERVAGGEDALHQLYIRFRNRYLCKYMWKPQKFDAIACTGCGRCIESCLGNINKNELFLELLN